MMGRGTLLLCLVAAGCTGIPPRSVVGEASPASVREANVEVVNATGRELPAPRPGLAEGVARWSGVGDASPFSAAAAVSVAAAAGLRERGIGVGDGRHPELPLLRVTLLDFEIRDHDAAGAVAFISAKYVLSRAAEAPLWQAAQKRRAIPLAGPDLTRSELARIAGVAVSRALVSLPAVSR